MSEGAVTAAKLGTLPTSKPALITAELGVSQGEGPLALTQDRDYSPCTRCEWCLLFWVSSVHTQSCLICCRKLLFLQFFCIAGASLQSPAKGAVCNVVQNSCFPSQSASKVILRYTRSILQEEIVHSTCYNMIDWSKEQSADVLALQGTIHFQNRVLVTTYLMGKRKELYKKLSELFWGNNEAYLHYVVLFALQLYQDALEEESKFRILLYHPPNVHVETCSSVCMYVTSPSPLQVC